MKNIIVRIIGLITLIVGVGILYNIISGILTASQTMKFLPQLSGITLAWMAIYGGSQALKAKELGRKMLVVWLSGQLSLIALIALLAIFYYLAYPKSNVSFSFSNQGLMIAYLAFCIPVLIVLALIKPDNDLLISDSRQIEIIGKLLSVLSPGLGRMLAGNFWLGTGLFILYSILITGIPKISINGVETTNPIVNFVYGFIVWSIFAQLDLYAVKIYGSSKKEQLTIDPKADSA